MDIQGVFYVVAIVFMIMWILVLVLGSVLLWELYTVVKNAPARIEAKIDAKINEIVENAKAGIMGTLGVSAATFILKRIKNIFSRK